jgi:hypothetical protein
MRLRFTIATALTCSLALMGRPQENTKKPDQLAILQQVLTQIYQPSDVGKRVMGIGGESDVRKPGTIVVIQRQGLFGSLIRNETASSAIHGLEAKLYRGHQDYAVPVGERFYLTAVHVGSSTVDIGLLSARPVSTKQGRGRVWTIATFYLPEEVLANADRDAVTREIDQWLLPETRSEVSAKAVTLYATTAPVTQVAPAASPVPANRIETLTPGMTREQVLEAIGKPLREVAFQSQTWMHYSGMVVALRDGKLEAVESAGNSFTATVAFRSDPGNAEIFIDNHLAGSTPSSLQVPSGNHQISLRLVGYHDWVRDVMVLAGSDTQFNARLEKK